MMDLFSTDGSAQLHIDAGMTGFHKAVLTYKGQVLGSFDKQHLADLMDEFLPSIAAKAAQSAPPASSGDSGPVSS